MNLEEQLAALNEWPRPEELSKPDQGSSVPYLSGDMVKAKLNRIFGPANWGYETISWPRMERVETEKEPIVFYRGEYEIWFRLVDGSVIKRQVTGMVPVRGDLKMNTLRMAIGGCVTDAIKEAAATLGPALGLGINDPTVAACLKPRPSPAQPVQSPQPPAIGEQSPTPMPSPRSDDLVIPAWADSLIERHDALVAANPNSATRADTARRQGLVIALTRKLENHPTCQVTPEQVWKAIQAITHDEIDLAWLSLLSSWIASRDLVQQATELVDALR